MNTSYSSQSQSLNEQIAHDAELAQSWLDGIIASSPLDTMEVRLVALHARLGNALEAVRKLHRDLRTTLAQAPVLQSTQRQTLSSGQIQHGSADLYSTVQIPPVTDAPDSSQGQEYDTSTFSKPPKGFLSGNDSSDGDVSVE